MMIHPDVRQCSQAADGAVDRAAQLVAVQVQVPARPPRSTRNQTGYGPIHTRRMR